MRISPRRIGLNESKEETMSDKINDPEMGLHEERIRRECGEDAWWHERSLGVKILMGIGFGILGLGFLAFMGWVVMALWNWLMPDIFGLTTITYWQAWGLLALSTILFKGFGSGDKNRSTEKKRKKHLRRYIREEVFPDENTEKGNPEA